MGMAADGAEGDPGRGKSETGWNRWNKERLITEGKRHLDGRTREHLLD